MVVIGDVMLHKKRAASHARQGRLALDARVTRVTRVTQLARAGDALTALRAQGVQPTRLCADSRALRAGDVFIAYPGSAHDGRQFIEAAIQCGVAAVVYEQDGFRWQARWNVRQDADHTIAHVGVRGLRQVVSELAHEVYGRPSERLWVVGVTGTNGKTSTTQWIAQALEALPRPSAVIGTLGIGTVAAARREGLAANPNTTPDPIVLQEALARFVRDGAQCAAMEVSSIGLDQHRTDGIRFDCAIFTNLTRDHLDYHGDLETYALAKMRLFEYTSLSSAILNLEDPFGVRIAAALRDRSVRRIGYSASGTAAKVDVDTLLCARDVHYRDDTLAFEIFDGRESVRVHSQLVGGFNVANLLAVCAGLLAAGIDLARAGTLLETLEPVPGRMQRLNRPGQPSVIIDYAHTPDALEQVLTAARQLAQVRSGRLIVVFGCGGDRDAGKRAPMGAIAVRGADQVIVTNDNPRSESAEAIIADIMSGISGISGVNSSDAAVSIESDRRRAIAAAIAHAAATDVVVLAGKGHESYQEIAGVRYPFSDLDEANAALAVRS